MSTRLRRRQADIQNAVGYIRVSSEEQAKGDRFSLPAQRKEIQAYCARRGWTLVALYEDAGHSAKGSDLSKRPAFRRMLEDVKSGTVRCDVIVTHTLDRYARNLVVALTTLADLHDHGITYSSVTESDFDYSDPDRRLHLQILAMFAEYFSEKLSQHTSKGKKERAASGLYNGDLPYGYANPHAGSAASGAGVANSAVPVVVPDRAAAVRRAFDLYATGQHSDSTVAQTLNAEGYRMVSKRHPAGYPFTKDTLTMLLQNPFYAGAITYSGGGTRRRGNDTAWIDGQHEALIGRALFDRCQALRAARCVTATNGTTRGAGRRGTTRPGERIYIAGNLTYCICCRQALRAQWRDRGAPYYRDVARERGLRCTALRHSISTDVVHEAVAATVGRLRLPSNWRALILSSADTSDDEAVRREAQRAALERKRERLKHLVKEGIIDTAEYRTDMATIEADLATLAPVAASIDLEQAAARLANLPVVWADAEPDERRDLARALFEAVWVDLDGRRVVAVQMKSTLLPFKNVLLTERDTDSAAMCVPRRNRRGLCTRARYCGHTGITGPGPCLSRLLSASGDPLARPYVIVATLRYGRSRAVAGDSGPCAQREPTEPGDSIWGFA